MAAAGKARAKRKAELALTNKAGIPQGFIRFDSVAHRILKALHEFGPMSLAMLCQEMPADSQNAVSITMTRMKKFNRYRYKLVKIIGADRLPGSRSHAVYQLGHLPVPEGFESVEHMTRAERTRAYRERKKAAAASSIFNFAGFGSRVVKDEPVKKQPAPLLNWKQGEFA
jgi:hypothetical protein